MPDENLVNLTIDGQTVSVPKGTLIVEAAKKVEIEIPVFCYHHKLDPVGACRLCLVEITPGPPRAQTACTTPVAEGMTVMTQSTMAVGARADILEYELVNHPLDCPVCDKGGECPLQDYTFRHGNPVSRVDDPKLHFKKPIPLSDKIALDRERCVLCYRCTRYYDEVAWEQELTTAQRGVQSYITSQFDEPLQSVFSGNIIDLCPVGALTSRVWRFESRPWDMDKQPSVCSKCSVGCNVTLWQRRGQLVRVTSRENDAIDDGWICDRGRFDYTYVNQEDRIRSPKVDGQPASWDQALSTVALGLSQVPAAKLGIHLPADITNEEVFLLSQLLAGPWRGAKVSMAGRTRLPLASVPTMKISDLDKAKTIVVIASDTRVEVPVLNLRIKKAVKKLGANLIVVHPATLDLVERWQSTIHIQPGKEGTIAAINQLKLHPTLKEGPVAILYGDMAGNEDGEAISTAVAELATAVGASVLPLYRGANERGALEAGILNANGDFKGVEALLTWGSTPKNLPKTVKFLTIWESNSRSGQEAAAVVLPAATFAETQGTYMNLDGTIQPLGPVLTVESPLRESWEVLLELSQLLGLQTSYLGPAEIQKAAAEAIPAFATLAANPEPSATPVRVMMGPARP